MDRREYLKLIGAAGASTSLAGCLDFIPGIGDNDNETNPPDNTTTPPMNNTTKTPTPTPTPPERDTSLPTRLEMVSDYSRVTDYRPENVEVTLVGDDIRADTDLDEATLVVGAISYPDSPFGSVEPDMERPVTNVPLPERGEERDITLPTEVSEVPRRQIIYYYVRLTDPTISEDEQFIVCESNPFIIMDGEVEDPSVGLGLIRTGDSTDSYRRYIAEGYYLIAVNGQTLTGDDYLFELPVFKSQYLRATESGFAVIPESVLNIAQQNEGLQRAYRNANQSSGSRGALAAGIDIFRSLPDSPSTIGEPFNENTGQLVSELLVRGGGDVRDTSLGIIASADAAGYDVAAIEPTGYYAPGVAGEEFSGFSVTNQGTDYYYIEPAARTEIGEISQEIRDRAISSTVFEGQN